METEAIRGTGQCEYLSQEVGVIGQSKRTSVLLFLHFERSHLINGGLLSGTIRRAIDSCFR